jgi:hypothetical protein
LIKELFRCLSLFAKVWSNGAKDVIVINVAAKTSLQQLCAVCVVGIG